MRKTQPWNLAWAAALAVSASVVAFAASDLSDRNPQEKHLAVSRFLELTESFVMPASAKLPEYHPDLLQASSAALAQSMPDASVQYLRSRIDALGTIKRAIRDSLLEQPGVVGLGIGHSKTASNDVALVFLVEAGIDAADVDQILRDLDLTTALDGFETRVETRRRPILNGDYPPGRARALSTQAPFGMGTVGWYAVSKQNDELDTDGISTGRPSVGFFSALHVTAGGPVHTLENAGTLPREVSWKPSTNTNWGGRAGSAIRSGPNVPGIDWIFVDYDIDWVSMTDKAACDAAHDPTEFPAEGEPVCPSISTEMDADYFISEPTPPADLLGIGSILSVQVCGGTTQQVERGQVNLINVDIDVEFRDWSGNQVNYNGVPVDTKTIHDLIEIMPTSSLAFSQPGDSGGPVWVNRYDQDFINIEASPIGVVSASFEDDGSGDPLLAYATPVADYLDDYDVVLTLDNPRDPESEICDSGCGDCDDCECEIDGFTGGDAVALRDFASGLSPKGVAHLTRLAVESADDFVALSNNPALRSRGQQALDRWLPIVRGSFDAGPAARYRLQRQDIQDLLSMAADVYPRLSRAEMRVEISRLYRFAAVYGEGLTVQEFLRTYLRAYEIQLRKS